MSSSNPNFPPTSQPSRLPRPATAGATSASSSIGHTHNDAHTAPRRQYQQSAVNSATSQPSRLPRPAIASSPPSTAHPRNNTNKTPRRHSQQPADNDDQDDPFFSKELFKGMRDGHPDNAHVGRMYTRAQEREYDAYYERVMGRRGTLEEAKVRHSEIPPDYAFVSARTLR